MWPISGSSMNSHPPMPTQCKLPNQGRLLLRTEQMLLGVQKGYIKWKGGGVH